MLDGARWASLKCCSLLLYPQRLMAQQNSSKARQRLWPSAGQAPAARPPPALPVRPLPVLPPAPAVPTLPAGVGCMRCRRGCICCRLVPARGWGLGGRCWGGGGICCRRGCICRKLVPARGWGIGGRCCRPSMKDEATNFAAACIRANGYRRSPPMTQIAVARSCRVSRGRCRCRHFG